MIFYKIVKMILFCVVLLPLINFICGEMPVIITKSGDVDRNIGDSVDLYCQFQNLRLDSVPLWYKVNDKVNKVIVIATNLTLAVSDNRFSVRYASNTYYLRINNIKQNDTAIYRCSVQTTTDNIIEENIHLQVRYPPVIHNNATTSRETVILNNSAKLECNVSGYPNPKVLWTHNEQVFNGNILRIPKVRKEDAGDYHCVADNKVGESVKKLFRLEVEFAPIITAINTRVGQALKFNATLECRVEAHPAPVVSWIKDGKTVQSNQQHILDNSVSDVSQSFHKLIVNLVDKKQYGTYICKAENKHGRNELNISLYETDHEMGSPSSAVDIHNLGYNDIKLILSTSIVIFAFGW